MSNLGTLDLEFLYLGIKKNGTFNEKDIEESELKRLGVGRTLDALASLKERNLILMNSDGTFTITDTAKNIFWDHQVPLRLKILRILDIKAFPLEKIATYLNEDEKIVFEEIERLRKEQLVMMSPLRTDSGLEKMYEILDAGIAEIEKPHKITHSKNNDELIDELILQIKKLQITDEQKNSILDKITLIKEQSK
ncbi:MAG: hypothetical protein DWQ18_03785 [Crenarchaeota archaeon]|nr:MAG: hypothetical protein DWQ17_09345 [Thermoproteota archaeon]RDJ34033.1 MAG: hypothetical protein DWQ18_03785 [Thermoproteota archaeon]RDJ36853.1 MAG: hypothetical protein DWQ13_06830 [Thermoproteota archaeon]RDJ37613.1 MAG: hypothetical protein DWQ19_04005 [Thermoproteota archaeon]